MPTFSEVSFWDFIFGAACLMFIFGWVITAIIRAIGGDEDPFV